MSCSTPRSTATTITNINTLTHNQHSKMVGQPSCPFSRSEVPTRAPSRIGFLPFHLPFCSRGLPLVLGAIETRDLDGLVVEVTPRRRQHARRAREQLDGPTMMVHMYNGREVPLDIRVRFLR